MCLPGEARRGQLLPGSRRGEAVSVGLSGAGREVIATAGTRGQVIRLGLFLCCLQLLHIKTWVGFFNEC